MPRHTSTYDAGFAMHNVVRGSLGRGQGLGLGQNSRVSIVVGRLIGKAIHFKGHSLVNGTKRNPAKPLRILYMITFREL